MFQKTSQIDMMEPLGRRRPPEKFGRLFVEKESGQKFLDRLR